ncbi:MAG: serine hydrolase domain-containing protein [Vicinamibacterales bacterium]
MIEAAIARRLVPAAALEVGDSRGALWRDALGAMTFDAEASPARESTIFDLASLTKPTATTTVMLELCASGQLQLDEHVSAFFADWRGADRERVTVRDLLEHASGLPPRLLDQPPLTRREFEHDICTVALAHAPRTAALYSDLGFILLAFLAADRGQASFADQFDALWRRLVDARPLEAAGDEVLEFLPRPHRRPETAPTLPLDVDLRRGRTLVAEVHDNYAAALGGVAGHAGLFGNSAGVGLFARAILRAARGDAMPAPLLPESIAQATIRSTVPGSSRALGWDTMLPTSSCGTRMSQQAFGHVGFTGTSLWIDPIRDRYFVLLTNRACGGGTLDEMRELRRSFHDALGDF